MDRFVRPHPVRLHISAGDFIDVKKRLNAGEHQDYLSRLLPYQTPGEKPSLDTRQVATGKVLAYLLGWSLTDDGRPVSYSLDLPEADRISLLNSLDIDTFREIREAIDAHEEAEDQARAAEKNGRGSETASPAISPLPSTTAGATTTSPT